jgi:hypothetical protein
MKVPTSELTLLGGRGAAVLGTESLTKLSTPQQDVSRRGNKRPNGAVSANRGKCRHACVTRAETAVVFNRVTQHEIPITGQAMINAEAVLVSSTRCGRRRPRRA